MRHAARYLFFALLLAAAQAASGCGGDSTTSATATALVLLTDSFSGSIGQNGVAVHQFTVYTSGNSLLAGYTSITPSTVPALGIGLGTWDTTTSACSLNLTQNDVGRSGSTAVNGTAGAGAYCLRVYDGANIGAGVTASYSVQVQHY